MLQPAPAGIACPRHLERAAAWICPRCGAFFCPECERRTRPDAMPMCAGCWDLRLEKVGLPIEDKPSTALQTASLVVGFVALLPLPTVQVVALIIAIVGMVKVSSPEQRATRWRAVAGFILALIGIAIDVVLMAVAR